MSAPTIAPSSLCAQPVEVYPWFQRALTPRVVSELVAATGQRFYQRLFLPLVILWGFVFQRLNPDHSCDAAVSYFASGGADQLRPGLSERMSDNTAGYCKARARLPLSVVQGALHHSARTLRTELGAAALWHGRPVGLLDGSTLRLPAEPELREHYGGASNQHGDTHWPLLRLVAGFDFYSGAALWVAEGPYRTSEQSLAVRVIRATAADFLWVGDRNFGVYQVVQVAHHHAADVLFRLNTRQAKALARQAGYTLHSGDDLPILWTPSAQTSVESDLPVTPIAGRLIYVRLERPGFRPTDLYLFTTLTDCILYPLIELVKLYGRRWDVELDLRHVKTTLDMEQLTSKSIDLVRKELWAGFLAYNLVRGLMGVAAQRAGLSPWRLSFARCWRRIVDTLHTFRSDLTWAEGEAILEKLLKRLSRCRLPQRRGLRIEPRAVWGRPQPFPKIKGSRAEARQAVLNQMKS